PPAKRSESMAKPGVAAGSRRPSDECHARAVVTDISGRAVGGKSAARELCDHRRLAVAGEPQLRAQPPIIREQGAQEPDEGGTEKSICRGKAKERHRIA